MIDLIGFRWNFEYINVKSGSLSKKKWLFIYWKKYWATNTIEVMRRGTTERLFLWFKTRLMGILHYFNWIECQKKVASLRCNNRSCGHRLSIEHSIPTEAFGKQKGRKIASEVTKADLLDLKNWFKVYHDHSKSCKMTGLIWTRKTF